MSQHLVQQIIQILPHAQWARTRGLPHRVDREAAQSSSLGEDVRTSSQRVVDTSPCRRWRGAGVVAQPEATQMASSDATAREVTEDVSMR